MSDQREEFNRFEIVSVPWSDGQGKYYATIDYDKRVFRIGNGIEGGPHEMLVPIRAGRKWRSQLREDAIAFLIGLEK